MSYLTFGFHTSSTGHGVPRSFYKALDAAGIPYFAKGSDSLPFDAQQIAQNSSVKHCVVYRRSEDDDGSLPPSGDPDVPDYNKSPVQAAKEHWEWHKSHLPPDLDPAVTWLETVNEVDKGHVAWLADFAYETAQLTLTDGYKWLAFGWSTGEPEPAHWHLPQMERFLRLCAEYPDRLGIALHEYSLLHDHIFTKKSGDFIVPCDSQADDDCGHLVGRFEHLMAACDYFQIARPTVMFTEWGWTLWNAPAPNVAMQHIKAVGELYAQYPNVKGAAIWCLNGGWQNIGDKVIQFVEPLKQLTLNTEFPDIEPPPDERTYYQILWDASVEYQKTRGIELNSDAALQKQIIKDGLNPDVYVAVHNELHHDDVVLQAIEAYGGNLPRVLMIYSKIDGSIAKITDPYLTEPAPAFTLTNWPTEYKYVTQEFGANPDDYAPYGLPGHEGVDIRAYLGSKIFAAAPGKVYFVETDPNAHNYGIHVRIEHDNGYITIYAHLQVAYVAVGDIVGGGAFIGRADSTGNSRGSHLHFGMKHPGGQEGWPANIIDPTPFLKPLAPEAWPADDTYTGPAVTFVAAVDNPASDWRWPQAKAVFDVTGLAVKFHTQGNNHTWFNAYKNPTFNLVRILLDPNFNGDIYQETVNNVAQFYNLGARDFEVLNEPNIEGMGVRWNSGAEFGAAFKDLCAQYKATFPGIRLWFPGMSPGFGAQYAFIDQAISVGAFDHIYGICEHVYSGIVDNQQAAVDQMVNEVMEFRKRYALTRPLVVSEFSVNRPASASYKAAVYKAFYERLGKIDGIQAAVSFTSDWGDNDPNQEGWLKWGIHTAFVG